MYSVKSINWKSEIEFFCLYGMEDKSSYREELGAGMVERGVFFMRKRPANVIPRCRPIRYVSADKLTCWPLQAITADSVAKLKVTYQS